jgi:hypothetical protein
MLSAASLRFLLLYSIHLIQSATADPTIPTCEGELEQSLLERYQRLPRYQRISDLCIYKENPNNHIRSLNCICLPNGKLTCLGKKMLDAPLVNNPELRQICFSNCACGATKKITHPDFGGISLPKLRISQGSDGQGTGSSMSTGGFFPGTEGTSGGGGYSSSSYYSVSSSRSQRKCATHCTSYEQCSSTRKRTGCSDSVCMPMTDSGEPYFYLGRCISRASLGLGLRKRDLDSGPAPGCLCNSSYIGKECCFSKTGIVHTQDLFAFD